MHFTIPGKPKGKTRPRFARNGKTTYTDRGTKEYEEKVVEAFQAAGGEMKGYRAIKIRAYYLIPQRTPRATYADMVAGRIRPDKKPDLDNVLKIILDALNGVAYADDNQICQAYIEKLYGEEPRVEVDLYEPYQIREK